jgi:hypothetical protein
MAAFLGVIATPLLLWFGIGGERRAAITARLQLFTAASTILGLLHEGILRMGETDVASWRIRAELDEPPGLEPGELPPGLAALRSSVVTRPGMESVSDVFCLDT